MKTRRIAILLVAAIFIVLLLAQATAADQDIGASLDQESTPHASNRLIVQLQSPSLVEFASSVSAQTAGDAMVKGRLNARSAKAQAHVDRLQIEQEAFVNTVEALFPQARAAAYMDSAGVSQPLAYQVVTNAVVLELPAVTPAAIRKITNMAAVRQVFRDYQQKPNLYASIPLINAPTLWEELGGQGMSGQGIIIASIDTGVYIPHIFFDPTGFQYPEGYPVGDTSVTTEKVIGARAYFRSWDPPLPTDAGALPGPNSNPHGTHTAGIAAGNAGTTAEVSGYVETISGVAPEAQILSYRIGYPTASEYSGSAFDAEVIQAYEDAVIDGADVINYSFGGYDGVMPWASATTLAREAAWDAGVFVSHSAGNSGPGASSTGDASPKVMEVAASTTSGTIISGVQIGNVPDVIASFSSRGPAYSRFLEPDVTAPGVAILSAGYGQGTGYARLLGFGQASGTSMAAPHVAGAAALLKQMHPDWSPTQIMSALMSTATTDLWLDKAKTLPAAVLDMGAGRIDLAVASNPGLTFDYPSLSFGSHPAGTAITLTVTATNVSEEGSTYDISATVDEGVAVSVNPTRLTFAASESKSFDVIVDTSGADAADYGGMVYLNDDDGAHTAHLPLWVRAEAKADARILLIDNDFSDLLGYADYTPYYSGTLDLLGWEFDYYNADIHFGNPRTLPTAAELAAYDVIIYWSGDNFQSNSSMPLTKIDMQTLSDWLFTGGRLFASGQDLASAWGALNSNFLYTSNLGAEYLHDSIFDPDLADLLPPKPSIVGQPGSPFSGLVLDLSESGDGAGNQVSVDEVAHAPFGDLGIPSTAKPVMAAIDGFTLQAGTVAIARAAYPTLEELVPPYDYRTLYLSFGFEGINGDSGYHTREDVMAGAMAWLLDSNDVTVHIGLQDVDSIGTSYRWDFGDRSPYTVANGSNQAVHQYDTVGNYRVRVEALNGWGATQLGSIDVAISEEMVDQVTYFTAEMSSNYEAPEPTPDPVSIVVPLQADTWVVGSAPTANYDEYASLATWTSGVDNILLSFDPDAIPADVEILSATLSMNAINSSGSLGKRLTALNAEAFDSATVTFASAPNVFNPSDSVPFTDLGLVNIDVTDQVAAWQGGSAQLAVASEGTFGRVSFDSLESFEAIPATLTVLYQP